MSVTLTCLECGRRFQVDEMLTGKSTLCKQCGALVPIAAPRKHVIRGGPIPPSAPSLDPDLHDPDDVAPSSPLDALEVVSPSADSNGSPEPGSGRTPRRGEEERNPWSPPSSPLDSPAASVIPSRNIPAIVSCYLGLFGAATSFIMVLGLVMPTVALVLGIKGLKLAKKNPEVRGEGHALVGIICGSLGLLVGLAIILFVVIMAAALVAGHR